MLSEPAWLDRTAWPWPGRWIDTGEGAQHVVDVGVGPVVLLVHGTPTWSFEWRHVIRALAGSHRVIAVDHLGFGLSDRPAGAGYRPEDHARRLAALVEALGLTSFDLVVHDFGGPIGLGLALEGDRVRRVVIVNTWLWSFEGDAAMWRRAGVAGSAVGRWLYRWVNLSLRVIAPSAWGDRRKLTPAIQAQYLAPFVDRDARVRVLWALAAALRGSSAFYEGLWARRDALARRDVLLVWGLKDSAFQPHLLARWREALPRAQVLALPDAGHWPHEEAPGEVGRAIVGFLAP
jgi:haloalkane dehalogenase